MGCGEDDIEVVEKEYGLEGTHDISTYTDADYVYSTVYYPSDLATMDRKSPLVFFASGWFGSPHASSKYESLLRFVASHGYTVIYTDEGSTTDPQHSINGYEQMLSTTFVADSIIQYIDTKKIGVIGSSAGAGITFTILDYFSKEKSYGEDGRFIMAFDPWFAFGMNESDMKNLPSNTNVVIIKFGEGGNNDADGTDARIPLTEYYLLESIADEKKDYQIYVDADHGYPTGNRVYSDMQGILKPLDALLDYTFITQAENVRQIALENGNDDPYANGNGIQLVLDAYDYPCDGANTLIDYCSIAP